MVKGKSTAASGGATSASAGLGAGASTGAGATTGAAGAGASPFMAGPGMGGLGGFPGMQPGMGGMGGFPGMHAGGGPSGMGGMPMNPQMMQQMMSNPMVQQML